MLRYSVVIPVYNVASYLRQCIDSVLAQDTVAEFEVILVDDGSTDESGSICDEYATNDKRFRVIHQENQGLPGARNSGLEVASGEYVLFLDSDDYWEISTLSQLDVEVSHNPDIVIFRCRHIASNNMAYAPPLVYPIHGQMTGAEYLEAVWKQNLFPAVSSWRHLYRREFLKKNGLLFLENQWFREDLEFYFRFMPLAKSVRTLDKPLYNYRELRNGSLSSSTSVEKIIINLTLLENLYRRFPRNPIAEYYCFSILELAYLPSRQEARKIEDFLREHEDILRSSLCKKARQLRLAYHLFGYYYGAKIMNFLILKTHALRNAFRKLTPQNKKIDYSL